MGKAWDHGVPGKEFWIEALRVAKPGAHLLAFGGTRCHHRLMIAIEDAGWEIRDCLMWVYGSGFPKSMDIGKAMDKEAGAVREVVGKSPFKASDKAERGSEGKCQSGRTTHPDITTPSTDLAKAWDGWGTQLKPAVEIVILARKPISESTIAKNVAKWGTGGLNIGKCRVGTEDNLNGGCYSKETSVPDKFFDGINNASGREYKQPQGRFPANLLHDGSDEVVSLFPVSKSTIHNHEHKNNSNGYGSISGGETTSTYSDQGSAARFFKRIVYEPKASKADRDDGCESHNNHPCCKPTKLLQYLCRLITPPNGLVLDPFCGSGSTGKACELEGFRFIGIEKEAEYCEIARRRAA